MNMAGAALHRRAGGVAGIDIELGQASRQWRERVPSRTDRRDPNYVLTRLQGGGRAKNMLEGWAGSFREGQLHSCQG